MKIIYIARSIIPSRDANSIQVMKMCQAFAANGHEIVLLVPDKKHNIEPAVNNIYEYYNIKECFSIKRIKIKYKKGRVFFEIIEIIKALSAFKPDFVYGRCTLGCTIACLKGYQTIYESHIPIWSSSKIKKYGFILLSKNKYFKKLVVISQALKNMYVSENIIPSNKVYVAHDGADEITDFRTTAKLSSNNTKLNIGYSGHLYPGKGMEIIAKISQLAKEYNFHIVGGTEKDIKHWKSIIQYDNVYFYGFKSQNDLSEHINSFDICLLPNQKIVLPCGRQDPRRNISEFTSPLKLFEYMAHRKAIISSDLPVLREVLNETNSVLVQCDNINEWIQAIKTLEDKDKRDRIAKKACDDFMANYIWKIRAENVLQ